MEKSPQKESLDFQYKDPNLSLIIAIKNYIRDEAIKNPNATVSDFSACINEFLTSLITKKHGREDSDDNTTATASLCHNLYSQVGKLTRKIHDSLDGFNKELSPGIGKLLQSEIPDTSGKIKYVINLTEESANKVINLAEKQISEVKYQEESIDKIIQQLNNSSNESLVKISEDLKNNLENQKNICSSVKGSAMEILTSQGFQDLSGQVLQKVTSLIEEVESNLVQIVKMFSEEGHEQVTKPKNDKEEIKLTGPSDTGCSQEDVNDLLASLGF